jgi:hypothetical protein
LDTVQDFEDLLAIFERHEVRHLIIGGLAFIYHAKPRYTEPRRPGSTSTPSSRSRSRSTTPGIERTFASSSSFASAGRAASRGQPLIRRPLVRPAQVIYTFWGATAAPGSVPEAFDTEAVHRVIGADEGFGDTIPIPGPAPREWGRVPERRVNASARRLGGPRRSGCG